jgi:hypothetical protein
MTTFGLQASLQTLASWARDNAAVNAERRDMSEGERQEFSMLPFVLEW